MKNLLCVFLAASCVASNVGAMHRKNQPKNAKPAPAAIQPQPPQSPPANAQAAPQQVQAALAQAVVAAPAAQNNPQVPAQSSSIQARIERTFRELGAKLEQKKREEIIHNVISGTLAFLALSYSCPRIVKSTIIASSPAIMAVAAYKSPTFRDMLKSCWIAPLVFTLLDLGVNGFGFDKICAVSILMLAGLGYVGTQGYDQWVDIKKSFNENVCIKAIRDTLSYINENPGKILAGLLTFLAGVFFMRHFNLISDETFAGFAIPLAGTSAWQCNRVKNYKSKKEDSEKKEKPSDKKEEADKKKK